jgi:hypothetical protein
MSGQLLWQTRHPFELEDERGSTPRKRRLALSNAQKIKPLESFIQLIGEAKQVEP